MVPFFTLVNRWNPVLAFCMLTTACNLFYVIVFVIVILFSFNYFSILHAFSVFTPSAQTYDVIVGKSYILGEFVEFVSQFWPYKDWILFWLTYSFQFLVNWVIMGPVVLVVWILFLVYFRIDRFHFLSLFFVPYTYYIFGFCCLFYLQCTFNIITYLIDLEYFYLTTAQKAGINVTHSDFPQFSLFLVVKEYLATIDISRMNHSMFQKNLIYTFQSPGLFSYFTCCADLLGLLFVGLTILIISLCLLFLTSLVIVETSFQLYVGLLLSILFLLNLVFLTPNLIIFFIAFESLLLPIIFLISLWGSPNKRQALNYLIFYTSIGAIPIMLAILYLRQKVIFFYNVNVMALSLIDFSWTEQQWLFLALFFSFAIKTPIVPVHIWLPKAHVDAPTTGSVILAGLLLKIGLFGFIRFLFPIFPLATIFFSPYIAVFASVGVLYASLITLWQIDIKRIIAYSSVAHINIALVSICSLSKFGCIAAIFMILSHGLISSALFFLVGFLYNRFHQRTVFYYGGLATAMPIFTIFFFFFTLANIAFPLTSGFISEFLCLVSIINLSYFLGGLNALSMLITTGYSILLFGRLCLDNPKPWLFDLIKHIINQKQSKSITRIKLVSLDLYSIEILIVFLLSVFVLIFGIIPVDLLVLIEDNLNIDIFEKLLNHLRVLK